MSMRLAIAIVMLIASSAASAQAEPWSRHSPFLCRTVYPADQQHVWFWVGLVSTLPSTTTVICPIPDTSDRQDSQITEVQCLHRQEQCHDPVRRSRLPYGAHGSRVHLWSARVLVDPVERDHTGPGTIWERTDFGYLEVTIGASDPPDWMEGYILVY